jgi:putative sigma-54 modulation protein
MTAGRIKGKENCMQLSLTGHHIDVTPALRSYVEKKFERIERHFDHIIDVHCILTVEKLQHKAEATFGVSGGKIHADSIDGDMYAAIDALTDKLDRRVKKYKEKLSDHHAADVVRARS